MSRKPTSSGRRNGCDDYRSHQTSSGLMAANSASAESPTQIAAANPSRTYIGTRSATPHTSNFAVTLWRPMWTGCESNPVGIIRRAASISVRSIPGSYCSFSLTQARGLVKHPNVSLITKPAMGDKNSTSQTFQDTPRQPARYEDIRSQMIPATKPIVPAISTVAETPVP
jgi:hypothetical protein